MGEESLGSYHRLVRAEKSPRGQSRRNYARTDVLGLLDALNRYV